jgi:tyrosyl-tRNA synthetase
MKVYAGFDPTSDSLHLGNYIPMMGLAWFQRYGHTPIAVVGGATGMIGDPSGKSQERNLLDQDSILKNLIGITKNLEGILDFNHPTAKPLILNNFDWFKDFSYLDFLREVGKHFRMGPMLAKDSVKSRLNSEEGISYTEFSYQVLQSYDFLHLFDQYDVTVQIGGSDQWGNITAGTELIRKLRSKPAFGVTFPLLTRSDGKKFGKSEEGAIWLSPEKLSYYEFYQYLVRMPDADVIKMLRILTFMEMEEIRYFENLMKSPDYIPNTVQRKLAEEVTKIVHGEKGLESALRATKAAAPGAETSLDAAALEEGAKDMPSKDVERDSLFTFKIIDLLAWASLAASKGDARKLVRNGGVYLNNKKIEDENREITPEDLIEGRLMLLAVGKKNKILIRCS